MMQGMGAVYPIQETNRSYGKMFEDVFYRYANFQGFYPIYNELSARWIGKGRVQAVKSQLDFTLVTRDGQVGFFDCKAYSKDSFKFSMLDPNQVERAVLFNERRVPAGFVVWFRGCNIVAYYTGQQIQQQGPGHSFSPSDGIGLGKLESFVLKPLFSRDSLQAG